MAILLSWLVPLLVSVAVGWLASLVVGATGGVIAGAIALALLVGWLIRSKPHTTGLFRANLKSYFGYRRAGYFVEDAVRQMAKDRYTLHRAPDSFWQVLEEILAERRTNQGPETEKALVTSVISLIAHNEGGVASTEALVELGELYDEFAARHPAG